MTAHRGVGNWLDAYADSGRCRHTDSAEWSDGPVVQDVGTCSNDSLLAILLINSCRNMKPELFKV